jgi:hypothetical protein
MSLQNYVIKFVSDLPQVGGFLRVLQFPPPIKLTESHNIIEILLKVALNTITLIEQIIILTTVLVLSYTSKSFIISLFDSTHFTHASTLTMFNESISPPGAKTSKLLCLQSGLNNFTSVYCIVF